MAETTNEANQEQKEKRRQYMREWRKRHRDQIRKSSAARLRRLALDQIESVDQIGPQLFCVKSADGVGVYSTSSGTER